MNEQPNNPEPVTTLDKTALTTLEYFDLLQQINELLEEWVELD